jgi:LacI family transcriptional regulator
MSQAARATLRTLARELDLSVTTVSRALKDGPEVHPDTVARVKAAAERADYRPDWRAVNLKTGRTGIIAILYYAPAVRDDFGDTSATMVMDGICRRLKGLPYMPMLQLLSEEQDGAEYVRRIVREKLADGVIISGTTPQDPRVKLMLEHRFPFVTFGRTELATPHPWYDIDNEGAAHQATEWLASVGRRRIGMINPLPALTFSRQRILGYKRALAEAGLRFDPALVESVDLFAASGREAAGRLIAAGVDAIVCATAPVALGALAAVRDAGLVPQRDVLVVSRDGARIFAYAHPQLPTAFASSSDAGWALADFLLKAIEGAPAETLQRLLPTRLIVPADLAAAVEPLRAAE